MNDFRENDHGPPLLVEVLNRSKRKERMKKEMK
jgi:hypothetical protein